MITYNDKYFLNLACRYAKESPDDSVKNGAVLIHHANSAIPLGIGYNHFPGDTKQILHPKELKRERICHAEMAALACAARNGYSTEGSVLYCTWAMCANCAKHLIDFGVKRIVTLKKTYDLSGPSGWFNSINLGIEMCRESGVIYELCDEEIGAQLFFRGEWIHV